MKIAVTGASGFIGRYVVAELIAQGIEVVAVSRDASRLRDFGGGGGIVEMDIASPPADCFSRMGAPDVLIHLAWDGLPHYNSLHHFESELPRQYHFLKAMICSGLSSLLVTGTCFEYGMQSGPMAEADSSRPTNPYGFAKGALLRQLEFLKSHHPFNLTWARLFYMYGEGQAKSSLYAQLQEAVRRGDKVFNMSRGDQLRDYLPVSEVARHIVRLARQRRDRGPVNICSGEPISVRRLVEQWLQDKDWQIGLNLGYYPMPEHEPLAFWGDRRRLDADEED